MAVSLYSRCGAGGRANNNAIGGKYVALAALERAKQDSPAESSGSGLLFGISVYHLRILCESPWNGGCGYTPAEVGAMTPDQVYFRLCDLDVLKKRAGRSVVEKRPPMAFPQGMVRGKDADGNPITLPRRKDGKTQIQLVEEELTNKQKSK